jgi:hypothetical protein
MDEEDEIPAGAELFRLTVWNQDAIISEYERYSASMRLRSVYCISSIAFFNAGRASRIAICEGIGCSLAKVAIFSSQN